MEASCLVRWSALGPLTEPTRRPGRHLGTLRPEARPAPPGGRGCGGHAQVVTRAFAQDPSLL